MIVYCVKIVELAELYYYGERMPLALNSLGQALKSAYTLNKEELKNFVKGIPNE